MDSWLRNTAVFAFSVVGIGLGAWVNARFQVNHNGDAVMIAVGIFSAVMASVSGYGLLRALRRWSVIEALIALLAFVISSGYNLQNALGISANTRTEHAETRQTEGDAVGRLQWQLGTFTNARTELAKLTNNKDAAVLRTELEGLRQDVAWASTKGCTDATLTGSRTYCAGYKAREAQLAAAEKIAELDRKIEAINNELKPLRATSGQTADPQANAINFALSLIGIRGADDGQVGKGLSVWFALLMWSFDSLGSVVGKLLFEPARRPASVPEREQRKSAPPRKAEIPAEPSQPEKGSGNRKRKKASPSKSGKSNVLPFKRRPSPSEVSELLASGKTQAEVAAHFGYSARQIRNIMKEAGSPVAEKAQKQ